jgi:hypothetical protein
MLTSLSRFFMMNCLGNGAEMRYALNSRHQREYNKRVKGDSDAKDPDKKTHSIPTGQAF